jgi:hypothetical protein
VVVLPDDELPELVVAGADGVLVVAEEVDVLEVLLELEEPCVDPGKVIANATAPAIPETPTAEVTAFIRARSRRRSRFGWSGIALSVREDPLMS